MTVSLAKYDEACRAIAAACAVDEVMHVRDQAEALRSYARQSKNKTMEISASEIRFRAERRIGELIAAQRDTVGLAAGRRTDLERHFSEPSNLGLTETQVPKPTLAEVGIDKNLADRARRYAAVPAGDFETLLATRRERIQSESRRVTLNLLEEGDKAAKRHEREARLGRRIHALPDKRYGLILADPEWRFDVWSRDTGLDRAADNHYPTSVVAEIASRDVASIAAADCVLALWATVPMLVEGLHVLGAWGFAYKSHYVWGKDRIGTGYWNRNKHELLLIGVKGDVPAPAMGTQWDSLIPAPVGVHSAKPECFLEMLEMYFPTLPKIELNRRGPARPGWDAWGNETVSGNEAAA